MVLNGTLCRGSVCRTVRTVKQNLPQYGGNGTGSGGNQPQIVHRECNLTDWGCAAEESSFVPMVIYMRANARQARKARDVQPQPTMNFVGAHPNSDSSKPDRFCRTHFLAPGTRTQRQHIPKDTGEAAEQAKPQRLSDMPRSRRKSVQQQTREKMKRGSNSNSDHEFHKALCLKPRRPSGSWSTEDLPAIRKSAQLLSREKMRRRSRSHSLTERPQRQSPPSPWGRSTSSASESSTGLSNWEPHGRVVADQAKRRPSSTSGNSNALPRLRRTSIQQQTREKVSGRRSVQPPSSSMVLRRGSKRLDPLEVEGQTSGSDILPSCVDTSASLNAGSDEKTQGDARHQTYVTPAPPSYTNQITSFARTTRATVDKVARHGGKGNKRLPSPRKREESLGSVPGRNERDAMEGKCDDMLHSAERQGTQVELISPIGLR